MPYWGKLIGALGGLATGRPWMAIIGLLFGHQFDRGFADRFTRFGPDVSPSRLEHLPQPYLRALFETMGHLAKADGRVTEDEIAGEVYYNYANGKFPMTEAPGLSVFYKDTDGSIYHTYSCFARGLDALMGTYQYLDLAPKGRDEDDLSFSMEWVRHHDRYED